jgi:hypothetical protein
VPLVARRWTALCLAAASAPALGAACAPSRPSNESSSPSADAGFDRSVQATPDDGSTPDAAEATTAANKADGNDATDLTDATGDGNAPGPRARIVSVDLPTAAPTGVLLVTADISSGPIDAVLVGSERIAMTDPTQFLWQRQDDPTQSVFALRLPAGLAAGVADLRLHGSNGDSDAYGVTVILPSTPEPAAANAIVFAPLRAADDPFPVSSQQPFPQEDPGSTPDDHWVYTLELYDYADAGICARRGTVGGSEHFCPDAQAPSGGGPPCSRDNNCEPGNPCNPIAGTYSLSSTANQVTLSIDRDAGGPEPYVGGWIQADGGPPTTNSASEYLVLRSMRTGIILTISHLLYSQPGGVQHCALPTAPADA